MMWPSTIVECDRYVYSRHDVRGSLLQVGTETAAGTAARFGVRQLTWEIVHVRYLFEWKKECWLMRSGELNE